MSQLKSRLLVFFIGAPIILILGIMPFYNYIVLHIALTIGIVICARELHVILEARMRVQPKPLFIALITSIPIASYIVALTNLDSIYIIYTFIFAMMISLVYEIFSKDNKESFANTTIKMSATSFGLIYLGLFSSYLSQLTRLPNASIIFITFILMVFGCDSLAWLFGMLLGKGNRGFIKVSPNKSIAGYIGGIFGSVIAGILVYAIFPEVFNNKFSPLIIIGICISFTSILGDLVESALKRSCEHKDSDVGGVGIPGRGGFLDSTDSIFFSIPVFYLLFTLFY